MEKKIQNMIIYLMLNYSYYCNTAQTYFELEIGSGLGNLRPKYTLPFISL